MTLTAADLVLWTLLAALGAVGLTTILRHAPIIRGQVAQAKKPWACDVCMPFYTVPLFLAIPITLIGNWEYAVAALPAYALAHVTLSQMSRPPGPPVIPPDLLE